MTWISQKIQLIYGIIRDAIFIWLAANPFSLAAALSYYAMLSLAPLVVIAVAIAGQVYGEQLAQSELINQIAITGGEQVAEVVQNVIANTSAFNSSLIASLVSVAVLLIGASSVFYLLSDTINIIWGISTQQRGTFWYSIRQRLWGILMVLALGFLLIGSLAVSTIVSTVSAFFADQAPQMLGWLVLVDDTWLVFFTFSFIFSAMFKVLAEADNWWQDVWLGGLLTAALFILNKQILRIYLIYSTITAVYGAAGSLVVLLVWVYNTGLIISFGAAFCKSCARHYGSISNITRFKLMTSPTRSTYARRPRIRHSAEVRHTIDNK